MTLYSISTSFQQFWCKNPALWYALFFYAGALFSLAPAFSLGILVLFLLIPSLSHITHAHIVRVCLGIFSFFVSYVYVSSTVILPPSTYNEISGKALLQVENVATHYNYGKSFYKLDLLITHFTPATQGFIVQNVPCQLTQEASQGASHIRPQGGIEYEVSGKLRQKRGKWIFTPFSKSNWTEKKSFFSLVEYRFIAKKKLVQLLSQHFKPSTVRSFLEGVLVGEFHDTALKASLKRFGLQHILVVSGFHFALLVAIFASLIRFFTTSPIAFIVLALLTTAYFLFIGPTASVFRAYIAASACLYAKLLQRESSGINALGLGILLVVIFQPLWCVQVGFQLSFLATLAILLLFPIMQRTLFSFWPTYSLKTLSEATFIEQAVFVVATFFLSALALMLAVTLLCLPMTLYAFGQFPLWGIFYNLFFPFGVSLAITCVLVGLCLLPLAPIAGLFLSLGAVILEGLLTLVQHAPVSLEVVPSSSYVSAELLVLYLCAVSFFGVIYVQRYCANQS